MVCMNGLALVIGNAKYALEKDRLNNAVNDADDISDRLVRLGFKVIKKINCTQVQFDETCNEFENELEKYEVGMFYYCGHGLQVDGTNYITTIDTNMFDEYSVTRGTTTLDEIIRRMNKSNVKTKIIVLDACRNNPLGKTRGSKNRGLAPVHAPKGTIIAFSTSPGQTAKDGGGGRNSIYTGAFLNHVDDPEIPVEEFFKRVRHSVYTMSKEQQTPWEHTSLIGDFYFNSGQLIHSIELPYRQTCVQDSTYVISKSKFDNVIAGLKSYVYSTQNTAIRDIRTVKIKSLDISQLFLLGRNIYQTTCAESTEGKKILRWLDSWLGDFFRDDENHVLNGMLYEMYFNSNGHFRTENIKNHGMVELFSLQTNEKYKSSFDFIRKQLQPFKGSLFFIPSSTPKSIVVEIELIPMDFKRPARTIKGYAVQSISFKGTELFAATDDDDYPSLLEFSDFKTAISKLLTVPTSYLKIVSNIGLIDSSRVSLPFNLSLKRV
jgi:hypothetical protein